MKLYEPDLKYIGSGDYIPIMVEVADIEEDEEYYVRQTDYAALARNARIVEWMRGRCNLCGGAESSDCRDCRYNGYANGVDNWTLPAGLEDTK